MGRTARNGERMPPTTTPTTTPTTRGAYYPTVQRVPGIWYLNTRSAHCRMWCSIFKKQQCTLTPPLPSIPLSPLYGEADVKFEAWKGWHGRCSCRQYTTVASVVCGH